MLEMFTVFVRFTKSDMQVIEILFYFHLFITFLCLINIHCSSRWLRTTQNNFILCVSIYYFSGSGYPVAHARTIKTLNLSTFHHTNFGELLVC